MRLAIVASHPVQYYAPLYCELARQLDLTVFYAHRDTAADQARAGFETGFTWDVDLLSGYRHQFLQNVALQPGLGRFAGVDTPDIRQELRPGRFDGVLLMGWYLKAFMQALYAARRASLPVLVRGDSQLDTPRSALKRLAKELAYPPFLRLFDAALVVGQRNRSYWQHYRYPANRMFSSPHCVDTARFAAQATPHARTALRAQLGIGPNVPVALFAGKLLPFKRPLDLVQGAAVARAAGAKVEVLVAGSGPLTQDMVNAAAQQGVPLHMPGFFNQTEMPAAYAAADVLVLPSNGRETWGLVANEALACGRPVLLSDAVGCAADLTRDGVAGLSFPMGDTAALGRAIVATIDAPPTSEALAAVSQAYSLAAAAKGITQALHAVKRRQPIAVSQH